MKSISLFAFMFILMSSTTFAYTEHFEDGFDNPITTIAQKSAQKRLGQSIMNRRYRYFKNKLRDNSYKNRKNQFIRHIIGRKNINVNDRSTQIKRYGQFKFIPYYDDRKEFSNVSYIRPNRKQTFKRRAINYYREGGYAGTKELKENVIYGSNHKVNILPFRWLKRNKSLEEVTLDIRDVQRVIGKDEQVATGYQKTTFRRGSSLRNFMSPYQK